MSLIEDYAVIGDTQTAALVGLDGSIDWLCLPRFDSGACFAALLGTVDNGRWRIAPATEVTATRRRYRGDSLVLETEFTTPAGVVRLVDCMPPRDALPDVIRLVEGVSGAVPMKLELILRFDYGSIVPWVRSVDDGIHAVAGPDAVMVRAPVPLHGVGLSTQADFVVREGEKLPFSMVWHSSYAEIPPAPDPFEAIEDSLAWWREWVDRFTYDGPARDLVLRSLLTLKALTFAPTGGVVAAATTSLPERIGGVRNWDYRFCWLRDASFTLDALINCGFTDEAAAWRSWLIRAVAGDPADLQIMYGAAGERRLWEAELGWLTGYEGSRPVRIGNAAIHQTQLDIYGEVMNTLHLARHAGLDPDPVAWAVQRKLLEHLETIWRDPDDGIWEVRGPPRHFTHSKMMAWVAFDRAVKAVERYGFDGPVDAWRAVRDQIHQEVCARGYDAQRQTFTQFYGSAELDASLLMMPLVGFLPAGDPRVTGTVDAVLRELNEGGFVHRYTTSDTGHVDGLPAGEGVFIACTCWLVDNFVLQGRHDEARQLFERVCGIANDVGLYSEEYDPSTKRMLGNFPQAFSHVALINSALLLADPSRRRGE